MNEKVNGTMKESTDYIHRTDPKNGEFSPTGIQNASCLRRFYYSKILDLKSSSALPLVFGSAFHLGVETFYSLRNKEDIGTVQMEMIKSFASEWDKHSLSGDTKRSLDIGIMLLHKYCDNYWNDTGKFELSDIEGAQYVPMPNGTTLLLKIDRILQIDSLIRVVDTKTTSMALTDYYFVQYINDLQTSLYWHAVTELLGDCTDIMIDAVRTPVLAPNSSAMQMTRRCFDRTELQIADALNTYNRVTDYITNVLNNVPEEEWPNHFYTNPSECNKYGGCQYLPICQWGLDHPSVKIDFAEQSEETPTLTIKKKSNNTIA